MATSFSHSSHHLNTPTSPQLLLFLQHFVPQTSLSTQPTALLFDITRVCLANMPQTRSNSYTTAQSLTGASPKEDQPFKKWVKTECSPASLDAANITGEAVGHPDDGMNTDQSDQLADDSDQIMDDDDDDLDDDADDEDDDDEDQSVEGDNSPPTRRRNTKPSKTNRRKERDSRREELYPELGNDLTRVQNRLSPNLPQEQFTLVMTLHRFILTRPGTTISRSQFRDAVNVLHRGNGKTSPRRPNRPVSVDPEDTSGGMYKPSWKGPSKTILNSRNGVFNPETGLVKGNHPKGAKFIHSDFTAKDLGLTQSQWAFLVIPGTPNPWQPGRQVSISRDLATDLLTLSRQIRQHSPALGQANGQESYAMLEVCVANGSDLSWKVVTSKGTTTSRSKQA